MGGSISPQKSTSGSGKLVEIFFRVARLNTSASEAFGLDDLMPLGGDVVVIHEGVDRLLGVDAASQGKKHMP